MPLPQETVLATSNMGKVAEFASVFQPLGLHIQPQSHYHISSVEETGLTFVENALIKARHAAQQTGLPALADDSGLIVDALNGAPGIYSARYAGENATRDEHIAKLLAALGDLPLAQRTARFYCALVYMTNAEDQTPIIAEGSWEGLILMEPRGTQGFGYEPVFYVPSHQCSAAEISLAEKMILSHRAQALKILFNRFHHHQ